MEERNILQELEETFRIFFKNDSIILTIETMADDIEYWDSLSHIGLINTIEKQYSLTFNFNDVLSFETVGDMVNCIQNQLEK